MDAASPPHASAELAVDWGAVIGRGATHVVYEGTLAAKRVAAKVSHVPCKSFELPPMAPGQLADDGAMLVRALWTGRVVNPRSGQEHFCTVEERAEITLEQHVAALRAGGRYSTAVACGYALRLASAVSAMHTYRIVHRSISPRKVLVFPGDVFRLSSGGASQSSAATTMTCTTAVVGHESYMAPELLCARPRFSPRSDVYSVGCVIYWLFAGRGPHEGELLIRHKIASGAALDMSAVPPDYIPIINSARALATRDRPTIDELTNQLYETMLEAQAVPPTSPALQMYPMARIEAPAGRGTGPFGLALGKHLLFAEETGTRGERGADGGVGGPGRPGDTPEHAVATVSRSGLNLSIEMGEHTVLVPSFLTMGRRFQISLQGGDGGDGGRASDDTLAAPGGKGGAGGNLSLFTKNPEVLPFIFANVAGGRGGSNGDSNQRAPSGAAGTLRYRVAVDAERVVETGDIFRPELVAATLFTGEPVDLISAGNDVAVGDLVAHSGGELPTPAGLELAVWDYDRSQLELIDVTRTRLPAIPLGGTLPLPGIAARFRVCYPQLAPFPEPEPAMRQPHTAVDIQQFAPTAVKAAVSLGLNTFSLPLWESGIGIQIPVARPLYISEIRVPHRVPLDETFHVETRLYNQSEVMTFGGGPHAESCFVTVSLGAGIAAGLKAPDTLVLRSNMLVRDDGAPGAVRRPGAQFAFPGAVGPRTVCVGGSMDAAITARPLLKPIPVCVQLVLDGRLADVRTTNVFPTRRYKPIGPDAAPRPVVVIQRSTTSADFAALRDTCVVPDPDGANDEAVAVWDTVLNGHMLPANAASPTWLGQHRGRTAIVHMVGTDTHGLRASHALAHMLHESVLLHDSALVLAHAPWERRLGGVAVILADFFEVLAVYGAQEDVAACQQAAGAAGLTFIPRGVEHGQLRPPTCGCGGITRGFVVKRAQAELRRARKAGAEGGLVMLMLREPENDMGVVALARLRVPRSAPLVTVPHARLLADELVRTAVYMLTAPVEDAIARAMMQVAAGAAPPVLGGHTVAHEDLLSYALQRRAAVQADWEPGVAVADAGVLARVCCWMQTNAGAVAANPALALALAAPMALSKPPREGREAYDALAERYRRALPDSVTLPVGARLPGVPTGNAKAPSKEAALRPAGLLTEARRRYGWGNLLAAAVSDVCMPLADAPADMVDLTDALQPALM